MTMISTATDDRTCIQNPAGVGKLGIPVDHVKCKISGMTGRLASGLETGC